MYSLPTPNMGWYTGFEGHFKSNKPFSEKVKKWLQKYKDDPSLHSLGGNPWTVSSKNNRILEPEGCAWKASGDEYIAWLKYIIPKLEKRGYVLNGTVLWKGDDYPEDVGKIVVKNNKLSAYDGKIEIVYTERK
jgi:hypothetical protein